MGLLGWVMMGLAIWHFTIFLPDRFWGGIVGAFVGSLVGAIVVGLLIYSIKVSSLKIPGENATDVVDRALRGPGALIGMALVYLEGMRRERQAPAPPGTLTKPAQPRARSVLRRLSRSRGRDARRRRFEIAPCPPAAGRSAAPRARRQRRARAGARAPRARRARRGARAFLDADEEHPPSASPVSTRPSSRSSRTCRRAAADHRSTATTTSTASARRRSSCARCARWAPTSTPTCPTAPATATG